MRFETER
jgi:hypothetical protein